MASAPIAGTVSHQNVGGGRSRRPIGYHRKRSGKTEPLAQVRVLGPQLFGQRLTESCILFFELKQVRDVVKDRSCRCDGLLRRSGLSGALGAVLCRGLAASRDRGHAFGRRRGFLPASLPVLTPSSFGASAVASAATFFGFGPGAFSAAQFPPGWSSSRRSQYCCRLPWLFPLQLSGLFPTRKGQSQ